MKPGPSLTTRQRQVLRLLAAGSGYREIARELHISEHTVRTHLSIAYARLGVDNRLDAFRRMGWLTAPPA